MNAIERQVLELIGEDPNSPDVFSDITPIRDSINAAVAEICMATGAITESYFIPLYAGQNFYRMSWATYEFGWVKECRDHLRGRYLPQTDLPTLAKTNPWWMKQTGSPESYFLVGQSIIGIDRAPGASGGMLEIHCVLIPKPYANDADPVRIRQAHERAAVYYAVSDFFAGRGDAGRASENFTKYLEHAKIAGGVLEQNDRQWTVDTRKAGGGNGNLPG